MKMKVPGTMELDEEIVRGSAAAAIMSRLKGPKLPTEEELKAAQRKLAIAQALADAQALAEAQALVESQATQQQE